MKPYRGTLYRKEQSFLKGIRFFGQKGFADDVVLFVVAVGTPFFVFGVQVQHPCITSRRRKQAVGSTGHIMAEDAHWL